MVSASLFFLSSIFVLASSAIEERCRDGIDNVIWVESYGKESLPVKVKNVSILVYDIFYKPSCKNGKVNIVMPGYFHIRSGFVDVPKDYDLFKGSQVRASVALNEKDVCHNGHSAMFIVPNRLCHFEMTSFVPHNICHLVQQKGRHTLEELENKLNFNRTLEIPPSPSFLGITLLDLLNGDYKIKIAVHTDGSKIAEFTMPKDYKAIQIGV